MAYVIDTNVAIHLRDGDPVVSAKIAELDGVVLLSIITQIELEGGVYRDPTQAAVRRVRLDAILASVPVLEFDSACVAAYRQIVSLAGYSRTRLLDRMIAAQAIAHDAIFITKNAQDFRDVPALRLVEW